MPDVRVDWEYDLFRGIARARVSCDLAESVATELSCMDNNGHEVVMNGRDHVNVFMQPFSRAIDSSTADVVITIIGYDYADRMRDIDERLVRIGTAMKAQLSGSPRVSLMFVPIPGKCWVAV